MRRRRSHERQRGYALLELTLVLLVAGLLAVLGSRQLANRLNDAQAESAAVWMSTVHKALLAYVQRYGPLIQEASDPAALAAQGYTDWRRPTVAQLKKDQLLSDGTPESTRLTGAARLHVWHRGDCPGAGCVVEALVRSERPLQDSAQRPDAAMTAQWLLAAGGEGAAVHADDPQHIRGSAFVFSSTLPDLTVLPPGTVGMAVTAEHQEFWNFLRVRDRRNPDFQGSVSLAGQLHIRTSKLSGDDCAPDGAVVNEQGGTLLVCRNRRWRSVGNTAGGFSSNSLHDCALPDGTPTRNPVTGDCSCPWFATAVPIFDSGEHPWPQGRQMAYLCIG